MNRKSIQWAAATVVAALAIGAGATTAQAATGHRQAPAATAQRTSITEAEAIRQVAANLLAHEGHRFDAQEKAELQAMADGKGMQERGKLSALLKLLKKVKGFAGAVAKSYKAFKAWYNGLPWYVKGPLEAAGAASSLYDIWQLFH